MIAWLSRLRGPGSPSDRPHLTAINAADALSDGREHGGVESSIACNGCAVTLHKRGRATRRQ